MCDVFLEMRFLYSLGRHFTFSFRRQQRVQLRSQSTEFQNGISTALVFKFPQNFCVPRAVQSLQDVVFAVLRIVASVQLVLDRCQVSVQVFSLDVITEAVCIGEKQSAAECVFGHHDVIVEPIHVSLGNFQDDEANVDGLVCVNSSSLSMNHYQIVVDNFGVFESR